MNQCLTPARAAPAIGASQNSQSCVMAWPPAKTAGPLLRAGFSRLAGTMKACLEGMETEAAFMVTLGKVRIWKIAEQELQLFDDQDKLLARLNAGAQAKAE
jgi:hypothetical protein